MERLISLNNTVPTEIKEEEIDYYIGNNNKKTISIAIPTIKYEVPQKQSQNINLHKKHLKFSEIHPNANKSSFVSPPINNFLLKNYASTPKPEFSPKIRHRLKKINIPRYKLSPIVYPEFNPSLLINGKNSQISQSTNINLYFKMLEFYIKIKIEYAPIYIKLDKERNGWITNSDVKDYFLQFYPDSGEAIHNFCRLIFFVSKSKRINKNAFLACCALVRFENSISNCRTALMLSEYSKVNLRLHELESLFKSLSVGDELSLNLVKSMYESHKIDCFEKCFSFIFAETVNFSRFLRFFPLFLWMNSNSNDYV